MLEVNNVCVSFRSERQEKIFGTARNQVLFDVSLKVSQGTCLGILGESGSGKSTLGRVICGLLKPDTGEVKIQDVSVYASRNGRKNLQKRLSVVFQDYTTSANPRFRVKEIIAEGLAARERNQKIRLNRLEEINRLLELVGLNSSYANRYPHELSGGEAQRVAIARAYVNHPQILLADEPTGNLDPTTSLGIMEVLDAINRTGTTIVMATHNEEIVNSMRKRVVELHTGKIVRDEQQGSYDSALYFPDAEVESKSHQALGTSDPNAKYRRQNAIDSTNAPDDTVDVEGATRAETVVNAVDVVAAAVHDGQGNDGIARLAKSVHSGRTGRYGEAFASVETTLTWGKGLSLEQMADQEQAEQTERNEQAKTSAENDASETGADEALALSAPPAPPVPPTQTEPPTPPEPPVPPAPSDENPEDTKEHD